MGLYQSFFPNVTWRYIGGKQFAHRITIQITEFMFQAGLWTYEDVENLAKLLLEKSENLITLESVCMRDSKGVLTSYPSFLKELETLFSDIKEYLCLIIVHMIILVNDKSLSESLS
jgi:hypothetical protein